MEADERHHLQGLLRTYQRRLWLLQEQSARFGLNTPPEVQIETEDLQAQIQGLQTRIESLGSSATGAEKESLSAPPQQSPEPLIVPETVISKGRPSWFKFGIQWCVTAIFGAIVLILVSEILAFQAWGVTQTSLRGLNDFIFSKAPMFPIIIGLLLSSVQWLVLRPMRVRREFWFGGNIIIWGILSLAARDIGICLLCNLLFGPILAWQVFSEREA